MSRSTYEVRLSGRRFEILKDGRVVEGGYPCKLLADRRAEMLRLTDSPGAAYTHVGFRRVAKGVPGAKDELRRTTKRHALNKVEGGYRALCGKFLSERSGTSRAAHPTFFEIGMAEVTCKHCLESIRRRA